MSATPSRSFKIAQTAIPGTPSRGKRLLAAGVIALLGLSLSGCMATGNDAPTRLIKKVTDGAEANSGSLAIRNVILVAQPDGSAVLVATVVNDGDVADQLLKITVNGIPATLSAAPLALDSNKPIIFAGDSANASAVIPGLNKEVSNRVPVVFTFENAATTSVDTLVVAKSDIYSNVEAPAAQATPSPSATN